MIHPGLSCRSPLSLFADELDVVSSCGTLEWPVPAAHAKRMLSVADDTCLSYHRKEEQAHEPAACELW